MAFRTSNANLVLILIFLFFFENVTHFLFCFHLSHMFPIRIFFLVFSEKQIIPNALRIQSFQQHYLIELFIILFENTV